MEKVLTSTALWQDFDPAAEPLDVNVLKTVDDGEFVVKTVYFTGRAVSDGKTRVLGKICTKTGKSAKSAVLIVDNYKAPINESELKFWANNGFVAMAIDFAGRRTKGICTLYPSSLDYCNSDVAKSYYHVGENAKQTKIYEYALNCMRAVTYLLQEEGVKSISVVTVKKGVTVGAIVLGTDTRITNGTVVFGSLHREYPPYQSDEKVNEMNGEELQKRLDYEEKQQMWLAGIAPQSYAMQTKIPVYVIVSSNSPFVSSLNSNKIYFRLNDDSIMLFLPMVMDYLPDEYAQGIVKWCKGGKLEEDLTLQQADEQGDNFVKISTKLPMSKVALWYSRNPESRARNWVKAPLKKTEGGYLAEINVYQQKSDIIAFALANGAINYTTPLFEMTISHPQKVKIPTRSIYAGNSDDNLLPLTKKGDGWHGEKNKVDFCKGYLDIYGSKSSGMATFAINDPCMRRSENFTVSFDVCCGTPQTMRVVAMSSFGFQNSIFSRNVQLTGDGKWQRVTLEWSGFHLEDGRQMSEDEQIQMLAFEADSEFIINNVFLV